MYQILPQLSLSQFIELLPVMLVPRPALSCEAAGVTTYTWSSSQAPHHVGFCSPGSYILLSPWFVCLPTYLL